jgi:hypothetical protein
VTSEPGSATGRATVPATSDAQGEVRVFEAFPELGQFPHLGGWHPLSPLLAWLIATLRPAITVELGPGDPALLLSTCAAVQGIGHGARLIAVRLPMIDKTEGSDRGTFQRALSTCSDRFGTVVTGYDDEAEPLAALAVGSKVNLLQLSLNEHDDDFGLPDLEAWLGVMAPGATIVVCASAADSSPAYAKLKQLMTDRYPSTSVPLGPATEAIIAQDPVDGATPVIELLQSFPSAVQSLLATFGEQIATHNHLSDESLTILQRLVEQQNSERETFLSALSAYKELTTRLSLELSEARGDLAVQIEAARLERAQLVTDFLDRLDELSAKLSTSSARYSAQLEDRDRMLEAQEQKVLAYAGQAAIAQSIIDDIQRSSSWRITAPVRLFSRIMARRSQTLRDRPDNG